MDNIPPTHTQTVIHIKPQKHILKTNKEKKKERKEQKKKERKEERENTKTFIEYQL